MPETTESIPAIRTVATLVELLRQQRESTPPHLMQSFARGMSSSLSHEPALRRRIEAALEAGDFQKLAKLIHPNAPAQRAFNGGSWSIALANGWLNSDVVDSTRNHFAEHYAGHEDVRVLSEAFVELFYRGQDQDQED